MAVARQTPGQQLEGRRRVAGQQMVNCWSTDGQRFRAKGTAGLVSKLVNHMAHKGVTSN